MSIIVHNKAGEFLFKVDSVNCFSGEILSFINYGDSALKLLHTITLLIIIIIFL